jgi:hypothetical protein
MALFAGDLARADMTAESAVKAGFVYNFAKFTEWPMDVFATANAPLNLCVAGNQPLSGKLSLLQGRMAQGHVISLRGNPRPEDINACHILYIDEMDERRLGVLLGQVASVPVLTVSDIDGFTGYGGIIGMHLNGERVQFSINLAAARQAGLKLSSQLLRLGKVSQ